MNDFAPLETTRPWVMAMNWLELAFLHWRVEPEQLEPFIPPGLTLQRFDGSAWLGVVPFLMSGVRARGLPPLPGTSRFLELNLRTYVTDGARPGVWFFSLDAENPLAVRAARAGFHLPYMDARMRCHQTGEVLEYTSLEYTSTRTHQGEPAARFHARYAPQGAVQPSKLGSLEHWLTERYCLYSADAAGRVYRGEIRHAPWPLQACRVDILENSLAAPFGVQLAANPELAHFAARLEVVAWLPVRVR